MSPPRWPSALIAVLCFALLPGPAAAIETLWREAIWLQPPGAEAPVPALLTLPLGWMPGDATVVLLPDGASPQPLRDRVMGAMLAAETAVLELDPAVAEVGIPGLPPGGPLHEAALHPTLAAALVALRRDVGAGLLVAIGLGTGEEAVLWAAEASAAGALQPGLAAAVALGGTARFRAGATPPPAEQWPMRAGLLCGLLARLTAEAEAGPRCRAAFLAPHASLLAAREP